MPQTIVGGANSTTPFLVLPYELERKINNLVGYVPGRENPEVALLPASLREGELQLFYTSLAPALEAFDMLTIDAPSVPYVYTDTDKPSMNMSFVTRDSVKLVQQDSIEQWLVLVQIVEVAA